MVEHKQKALDEQVTNSPATVPSNALPTVRLPPPVNHVPTDCSSATPPQHLPPPFLPPSTVPAALPLQNTSSPIIPTLPEPPALQVNPTGMQSLDESTTPAAPLGSGLLQLQDAVTQGPPQPAANEWVKSLEFGQSFTHDDVLSANEVSVSDIIHNPDAGRLFTAVNTRMRTLVCTSCHTPVIHSHLESHLDLKHKETLQSAKGILVGMETIALRKDKITALAFEMCLKVQFPPVPKEPVPAFGGVAVQFAARCDHCGFICQSKAWANEHGNKNHSAIRKENRGWKRIFAQQYTTKGTFFEVVYLNSPGDDISTYSQFARLYPVRSEVLLQEDNQTHNRHIPPLLKFTAFHLLFKSHLMRAGSRKAIIDLTEKPRPGDPLFFLPGLCEILFTQNMRKARELEPGLLEHVQSYPV